MMRRGDTTRVITGGAGGGKLGSDTAPPGAFNAAETALHRSSRSALAFPAAGATEDEG